MKTGETRMINGDRWTCVDLAPAEPLAEMVANILEEEGFIVMVRGLGRVDDAFSHLGAASAGATAVFVPEAQAAQALELIAQTVTDYEGDDLDSVVRELREQLSPEELEALGVDAEDMDGEEE